MGLPPWALAAIGTVTCYVVYKTIERNRDGQREKAREHARRLKRMRSSVDEVEEIDTEVLMHALEDPAAFEEEEEEEEEVEEYICPDGNPPPSSKEQAPLPATCAYRADAKGNCLNGFEVDKETKCCILPNSKAPTTMDMVKDMAVDMAKEEALTQSIEFLSKKVAKKVSQKMATTFVAKAGKKLAAKVAVKVAGMAAKMGMKGSAMGALAASGVGAPIAALMGAFELLSMGLDMGDVEGYNNFTENSIIHKAIENIQFRMQNVAREENRAYPMMFPIEQAFPKEWEEYVMPALMEAAGQRAFEDLTEEQLDLIAEVTAHGCDIPYSITKSLEEGYAKHMHSNPAERDDIILKVLQNAPTIKAKYLQRYPEMSDRTRYGVSLSPAGVKWWNESKKEVWFRYFDVFDNAEQPPEDFIDPPVAIYTKEYYVLNESNPGTADKPNMVRKSLDKPAALYLMGGHVVSYCEKPRDNKKMGKEVKRCPGHGSDDCQPTDCDQKTQTPMGMQSTAHLCYRHKSEKKCKKEKGGMGVKTSCKWVGTSSGAIDPRKYKVHFDDGTSRLKSVGCVYTGAFCTRMGMKFSFNINTKRSECWIDGGQATSEMLFGATMTRGIQRGMHNALGFTCDPPCHPLDYCENRKCNPKKKAGEGVGVTASWKCLTGHEAMGKCVECREKNKDCNGLTPWNSLSNQDCREDGSCFCTPGLGSNPNQCKEKRENCPDDGPRSDCKWDKTGCDHHSHCRNGFCEFKPGKVNVCREFRDNCPPGKSHGKDCKWGDTGCDEDINCKDGFCEKKAGKINVCRERRDNCPDKRSDCPWELTGCDADSHCKNGFCEMKPGKSNRCRAYRQNCLVSKGECEWKDTGCDADSHCADGYCDIVAGQPNRCRKHKDVGGRKDNEFCTSDEQCESGDCRNWYCNKSENCTITKKSECKWRVHGCNKSGDCKNGWCDIKAGQKPNVCRKPDDVKNRANGEFCNRSDTCASGWCHKWKCREKGDNCTKSKKDCDGDKTWCDKSKHCKDGYCSVVAGQPNRCRKKKDVLNRIRGEYCDTSKQCGSGLACHGWKCREVRNEGKNCWCECDKKGGHCDSFCGRDAKCCRFNHHDSKKNGCEGHGGGGEHQCTRVSALDLNRTSQPPMPETGRPNAECCKKHSQCASGWCHKGKCKAKSRACTGNRGSNTECPWSTHGCDKGWHCLNGGWCDHHRCRKPDSMKNRSNGEFCTKSNTCASGWCHKYRCREKGDNCTKSKKDCDGNRTWCDKSKHCKDGYCSVVAGQPNRCRKRKSAKNRVRGEYCDKTSQCKNGMTCHKWKCREFRNIGKNCWSGCNKKGGHCDSFCGRDAKCCRFNHHDSRKNGCEGHGGGGKHECTKVGTMDLNRRFVAAPAPPPPKPRPRSSGMQGPTLGNFKNFSGGMGFLSMGTPINKPTRKGNGLYRCAPDYKPRPATPRFPNPMGMLTIGCKDAGGKRVSKGLFDPKCVTLYCD